MTINWEELFKVRVANSIPEMQKHEIVKLLVVMKLLHKYRTHKNNIRIYTEFDLDNGCKCDVYFEDVRAKEVRAYEIQRNWNRVWLDQKKNQYKDWTVPLFNSADWIPINLNELSDNLSELNTQLDKYIF